MSVIIAGARRRLRAAERVVNHPVGDYLLRDGDGDSDSESGPRHDCSPGRP